MEILKQAVMEWIREILTDGIISNLSGLFDAVNTRVSEIGSNVGKLPSEWNESAYSMVKSLSENVIVPVASAVLALVMTYELIHIIIDKNSYGAETDTFTIFRWIFKTSAATVLVSNTWNIVMAVFSLGQELSGGAAGTITGSPALDFSLSSATLESTLAQKNIGELFGLWIQTALAGVTMWAVTICVFVIIYGRMMEIYLVTSLAPVPMATVMSSEVSNIGRTYLRSLFALAFQAFLIMVCVGIYSALIGAIPSSSSIQTAIWTCVGYTVLLCFSLFKTGSLSREIFQAH